MKGIVIKAYSGYYYVHNGCDEYVCSLRGRFRHEKQQVVVGDRVELEVRPGRAGVIVKVRPRCSLLLRPTIANTEQAVIVFSVRQPEPNPGLLERFLIAAIINKVEPLICFNKVDLAAEDEMELVSRYQAAFRVIQTSTITGVGLDRLIELLRGKISVFAGPSGVGKSTILNAILPGLKLKTGEIGKKLKRGKHTTRHVELIPLPQGGMVADAPGFSSLELPDLKPEDLSRCFPEMERYRGQCYFTGCLHDREPECAVKEAVESGSIDKIRYQQYLDFLQELKSRRRY
ncbi:MAG: putative ribosome biogenesis GTPase RsgA [Pelotomaculum sp. PtaB.Bin104]|nr:MAG: putative ribosome biogenesis GTPase RsgA [Pelotomaculum sp. PtaB.Bin104]